MTFKQLLKADKISKEALYYRGNFALYALGEVDKAIDLYQRALKIDPDFVLARYDLAVAYRGMGEVDKAIAEYRKGVENQSPVSGSPVQSGGTIFSER